MHSLIYAPLLALLLFGGHAIADYGLQSAYVAEHKVSKPQNPDWWVTLGAHSLIHGVFVTVVAVGFLLVTGRSEFLPHAALLGWSETALHFVIDHSKGKGQFSYRADQVLHYGCKLLWMGIILFAFQA